MTKKRTDSLFWGIILLAIGVFFLMENLFDIDVWEVIFDFWPLILVAIGIKMILPHIKTDR